MSSNSQILKKLSSNLALTLVLSGASLSTVSLAGDSKDDGGNYSASQVSKEVRVLSSEIHSSLMSYRDFLVSEKILSQESWLRLENAVLEAPTLVVYGELSVLIPSELKVSADDRMVPVDASNNDGEFKVRVSVMTWPLLDNCGKQSLLLHEYASLADLDTSLRVQFSRYIVNLLPRCQGQRYEFESFEDLSFPSVENYQF